MGYGSAQVGLAFTVITVVTLSTLPHVPLNPKQNTGPAFFHVQLTWCPFER